jgi:hypothetical protein
MAVECFLGSLGRLSDRRGTRWRHSTETLDGDTLRGLDLLLLFIPELCYLLPGSNTPDCIRALTCSEEYPKKTGP